MEFVVSGKKGSESLVEANSNNISLVADPFTILKLIKVSSSHKQIHKLFICKHTLIINPLEKGEILFHNQMHIFHGLSSCWKRHSHIKCLILPQTRLSSMWDASGKSKQI